MSAWGKVGGKYGSQHGGPDWAEWWGPAMAEGVDTGGTQPTVVGGSKPGVGRGILHSTALHVWLVVLVFTSWCGRSSRCVARQARGDGGFWFRILSSLLFEWLFVLTG